MGARFNVSDRAKSALSAKPYIIGIDPGLDGAVSVFNPKTHRIHNIIDMPTYEVPAPGRKSKIQRKIDVHALAMELDAVAHMTLFAVIEDVHSMPHDGVASSFKFGFNTGICHGVLAGCYLPYFSVSPQLWKSSLGVTADKRQALDTARNRFKSDLALFRLKKHHGRAEASLIAFYGFRSILPQYERML